jgi:SAM-dependent methyltransferase
VDAMTLDAYARRAADYAAHWEQEQPAPDDLHELVDEFFCPGPTADIGCGSGRDTAWLCDHGFAAVGYDPSPELLAQARSRHPNVSFELAALPELRSVPRRHFANVLCETVLMHLPAPALAPALAALLEILAPKGTLLMSWRVQEQDMRDEDGRLYAAIDTDVVLAALGGMTLLHDHERPSRSSAAPVRRIVARAHG